MKKIMTVIFLISAQSKPDLNHTCVKLESTHISHLKQKWQILTKETQRSLVMQVWPLQIVYKKMTVAHFIIK